MAKYSKTISGASKSIAKAGQLVQIVRHKKGAFDPVSGKDATGTKTIATSNALTLNYNDSLIASGVVKQGDVKVLIESVNIVIVGDVIKTVQGDFRVINVKELSPNGEVILYELQCRY